MAWKKGQSGNPRGRPRDDSAAQRLRERLAERAGEVVASWSMRRWPATWRRLAGEP